VFDLDRYLGHTWSLSDATDGIDIVLADKLTGLEGRLILLDPGHGGSDGGAVGNTIIEKDVNLDIALKLRVLLEEKGAVVIMTRSLDTKVDLLDRSAMVNLLLPDAVICIHSNSVISESPSGTETYYYNAEQLSRELAASVHKSLVDRIKLSNRGVFKKEYHMVKETVSPSILVEVGFLSNKQDASKLADPGFRQLAAEGIFDGIASYFSSSYHDIWAQMKDGILQSMRAPSYSPSDAYWPGLMQQEPWIVVKPALDESIITQSETLKEPDTELVVP
jgi:N-acetylmuramoyl-L-alanine amidase